MMLEEYNFIFDDNGKFKCKCCRNKFVMESNIIKSSVLICCLCSYDIIHYQHYIENINLLIHGYMENKELNSILLISVYNMEKTILGLRAFFEMIENE